MELSIQSFNQFESRPLIGEFIDLLDESTDVPKIVFTYKKDEVDGGVHNDSDDDTSVQYSTLPRLNVEQFLDNSDTVSVRLCFIN